MKKKRRKRKTTSLDRAVIKYQQIGNKATFEQIYHSIFKDINFLAKKYAYLFSDMVVEDLMQEAYLHVSMKVIPTYDAEIASFRTLVSISVKNKFRQLLKKIQQTETEPTGIPLITFSEYEFNSGINSVDFPDSKDFIDDVLVSDFLRFFKKQLTTEYWQIYWRIYRDPQLGFKKMAKEKGISVASLYRKCRTIYIFLKTLVETEGSNG